MRARHLRNDILGIGFAVASVLIPGDGFAAWPPQGAVVCTEPNAQGEFQVVADGTGGVIVCWVDIRHGLNYNQDIYAQRLDANGNALWTAGGVAVCTAPNAQQMPRIVSDAAGGVIVAWSDIRHGLNYNQDIYAQRVSAAGVPLWSVDGIVVCTAPNAQDALQVVSDGSSGAIVVWSDIRHGLNYNQDLYAQRVSAAGVAAWTANGVAVCTAANAQDGFEIVSDGAGGVVVGWRDIRHGNNTNPDIYAQRIAAGGAAQWTVDGVAVCTAPNTQDALRAVSDAAGGVILAWLDIRHGLNYNDDIYAQRVDAAGTPLWTANGVAVCTAPNAQSDLQVIEDGAGGVIVGFGDIRHGLNYNGDLYAQRLSAAGAPLWTVDGVAVCTAPYQQGEMQMISDTANGVICAFQDIRHGLNYDDDVYVQRIGAAGSPLWTANGVAVSTAVWAQHTPLLVPDGAGGALIAWQDVRTMLNYNPDLYAQWVDAAGVPQCTADGVALCTASNAQFSPQLVGDGAGGAILTFGDLRHGLNYNEDIYAQKMCQCVVGGSCIVPVVVSDLSAEAFSDRVELRWSMRAAEPDARVVVERREGETAVAPFVAVFETSAREAGSPAYFQDLQVRAGASYGYRIAVIEAAGATYTQPVQIAIPRPVLALRVRGAFAATQRIEFELPARGPARLELFAVDGRKVRTLFDGMRESGRGQVDLDGRSLPAGVYQLRLRSAHGSTATRVVVLK